MVLRHLCILFLLIASTHSAIDCSLESSCFGEPLGCDPNTNCTTLFQFEEDGSLNMFLRNFEIPYGYAAFAVEEHADETIDYFICLPKGEQRLRAIAELGGVVLITEQNTTGVVEKLDKNLYRCFFNASEIPPKFQQRQVFFVSRGVFDEVLVILDGVELFEIEDESDDYEDDSILPTLHYIGVPAPRSTMEEDVFTDEDNSTLTEAVEKMSKVGGEKTSPTRMTRSNNETEDVEEFKPRRRRDYRHRQSGEEYDDESDEDFTPRRRESRRRSSHDDDEDDYVPRRRDSKSRRRSSYDEDDDEDDDFKLRRRDRKTKSRHENDYDDEDVEDNDDDFKPRHHDKKSRRRSSRRRNDDDEDEYENSRHPSNRRSRSRRTHDEDVNDEPSEKTRRRRNKDKTRKDIKEDDEEYTDEPYELEYDDNQSVHIGVLPSAVLFASLLAFF